MKWVVYKERNAYTGFGCKNIEGEIAAEWDAVAKSRAKVTPEVAQVTCNFDRECQGFTYDSKEMIYWKVTDVDPSMFKRSKADKHFVVYVKEEDVKANARKKRHEYVQRKMKQTFSKYLGGESWIIHEFCNAHTGHGAVNIEGRTKEEWDSVAQLRGAHTLAEAKEACDGDNYCDGFTYDPENQVFWKLIEIDPRGFKRARGHEYHVYVKERAHLRFLERYKAEQAEDLMRIAQGLPPKSMMQSQAIAGKGGDSDIGGKGAAIREDVMAAKGKGKGDDDMPGKGPAMPDMPGFTLTTNKDGIPGIAMAAPPAEPNIVIGAPPAGVPSKASPPEPAGGKGVGKIDEGVDALAASVPKAPVSVASQFDTAGKIESAPMLKPKPAEPPALSGAEPKAKAGPAEAQPAAEPAEPPKPRKPKKRGPPPKTDCTTTLHGFGFEFGREDAVLDACQELAFIEGFPWPDYATVVEMNLCHIEWPSPEAAEEFFTCSGGSLLIDMIRFTVRPPIKKEIDRSQMAPDPGRGEEALPEGIRVQIMRLTGARDLNDKFAFIHGFNDATGRYIVKLEDDEKIQKSLKPDNLKTLPKELAVAKAKAAPAKKPTVILAEGTRVIVEGMTGKDRFESGATDIDGRCGAIRSYDAQKNRYMVELEEVKGIQYRLRPEVVRNLDTGMSELEKRKKRALEGGGGGGIKGNVDVQEALGGMNGDMWANFLNFTHDSEQKKRRAYAADDDEP